MHVIKNEYVGISREYTRLMLFMIAAVLIGAAFIAVSSADNEVSAEPSSIEVSTKDELVNAVNNAVDNQVIIITKSVEIDTTLQIMKKITLTTAQSSVTISASESFQEADITEYKSGNKIGSPGMIYIGADNNGGSLTLGESIGSPLLTLDGKNKWRVIYNTRQDGDPFDSLIINSAKITGGYADRSGAGVFNTHGAWAVMNGGEISGNTLNQDYVGYEQSLKYAKDVWNGSGAKLVINGGSVGYILQNTQKDNAGSVTINGGHIDSVYVVCHETRSESSIFYYEGGTVDHILLSSRNNGGKPELFTHIEVMNPESGKAYQPSSSFVAHIGDKTYNTIYDAINAAQDGEMIKLLCSFQIGSTLIIANKKITLTSDSPVTIKASDTFSESVIVHPYQDPNVDGTEYVSGPGMVFINGTSGAELTLGASINSPIITLDANQKCRVIHNLTTKGTPDHVSLTINSAKITNGSHIDRGAGVFNTYKGWFVMNGGEISGNSLEKAETRYCKAIDVFNGSGARAEINGGTIGYLFQHSTVGGNKVGKITLRDTGSIESVYLDYPSSTEALSTFKFEGGTVNSLLMETSTNGNSVEKRPFNTLANPRSGEYHSGDVVLLVGATTDVGYRTLNDAYDNVTPDYHDLKLLMDTVLSKPLEVTKNVVLKQMPSDKSFVILPANNNAFLEKGAMFLIEGTPDSSVTFELDGPTINGNEMYRCVKVNASKFILKSGLITNGFVAEQEGIDMVGTKGEGAGIVLQDASFVMSGGTVTRNAVSNNDNSYYLYSADISSTNTEANVSGGTIGFMACFTEGKSSTLAIDGNDAVISNLLMGSFIDNGGNIFRSSMVYSDNESKPSANVGLHLDYVSDKTKVYPINGLNDGDKYYGGVSIVKWYLDLESLEAGKEPLEIDEVLYQEQLSSPNYDGETPVKEFDQKEEVAYKFLGWVRESDSTVLFESNDQMDGIGVENDMTFYGSFESYNPEKYKVIGTGVTNGHLDKSVAYYHQSISIEIIPNEDHFEIPTTVTVTIGGKSYDPEYKGDGIINIPEGVVEGDIVVVATCPVMLVGVYIYVDDPGLSGVKYKIEGEEEKEYTEGEDGIKVEYGKKLTLTAVVKNGFRFVMWTTDISSNPYTFEVTEGVEFVPETEKENGNGEDDDPTPGPSPTPTPTPKPKPAIITVEIIFESSTGGKVSMDSVKIPLNSKVTLNGDTLIIGSGSNKTIVKAEAFTGFVFDSWSIEDGNVRDDCNVTAKFRAIALTGIVVETSPVKTDYKEGEMFDPSGLVIIAGFDNMSSMTVGYDSNKGLFTFSPSLDAPLKTSDGKVTVYYNGKSADIAITVTSDSDDNTMLYVAIAVVVVVVLAAVAAFFLLRKTN